MSAPAAALRAVFRPLRVPDSSNSGSAHERDSIPLTEYFPFRAAFLFVFGNPKVVLPMNAIQCNSSGMNATILMRIRPDLRSKYAIRVDGETVGNLETLDEALLALERLRDRDFTVEQARKMLDVSVP